MTQLLTYGQLGSKQRKWNHPTKQEWSWLLIHFCFLVCFHWWFVWLECVSELCHIFTNYSSVLFYGLIYYMHNSLWLSRAHTSFSIPNATNFYRFWGILRNNNCHWEMVIHEFPGYISPSLMFVTAHWAYQGPIFNWSASVHLHFALKCSPVFTYLYMAHGCAIPSIMFYQHMCTAFCLWILVFYLSQSLSFSFSEWITPLLFALH